MNVRARRLAAGVPMKEYWTIKDKLSGERLMSGGWTVNSTGWWKFDSRISALEKLVQLQKYYPTMRHVIVVHHTKKPRGAKVGTWAWACEQMLAGKEVRMAGSGRKYAIANGLIASHLDPYGWHTLPGVFTHMLRGTEWRVVT